jgi:tetratricopeptide (TPR) repeat protein
LNLKAVAWLMAMALVLAVGIHFLHAVQVKRNASALLYQADQLEKRFPSKALFYMSCYLALKPDDDDVRLRYGMLLSQLDLGEKASQNALDILEPVLKRRPDLDKVRRRVARLTLRLERYAEAVKHLTELQKRHPKDSQIEMLLGLALEGRGVVNEKQNDFQDAEKCYREAIEHGRHEMQVYIERARLIRQHPALFKAPTSSLLPAVAGLPASFLWVQPADEVMDKLVANNHKSFEAYFKRALYRKDYNLPGAEQDLEQARKWVPKEYQPGNARNAPKDNDRPNPKKPSVRSQVMELALTSSTWAQKARDQAQARAHLKWAVELDASYLPAHLVLVQLDIAAGRLARAREGLGEKCDPTNKMLKLAQSSGPEAVFAIANLQMDAGNVAFVEDFLDPKNPDKPAASLSRNQRDFLQARLDMAKGNWTRARDLLDQVREGFASDRHQACEAAVLQGRCFEHTGEPDRQLKAFRWAVDSDPSYAPANFGLAEAYLANGQTDDAIDLYTLLKPHYPEAGVPLARLLIQRNLHSPRQRRGGWPNRAKIDALLDAAAKADPRSVDVPLLWAQVRIAHGQAADAVRVLQAARQANPGRVEFWSALADLAIGQGNTGQSWDPLAVAEGWAILAQARRQVGDTVPMRLAQARFAARAFGRKARVPLAVLGRDPDHRFTAPEWVQLWLGRPIGTPEWMQLLRDLGELSRQVGDDAGAQAFWHRVAKLDHNDLNAQLVLFDLALRPGHANALDEIIEKIAKLDGEQGALTSYCRAARGIVQARRTGSLRTLAEARDALATAAKIRPHWPRLLVLRAEIADLEGKPEAAIQAYTEAVTLGDRRTEVVRRLVELLRERFRFQEATAIIKEVLQEVEADRSLARLQAELFLDRRDFRSAVEFAREAVSADSADYKDHVWLGQILFASNRVGEARKEFHRAVELAGTAPQAWLALVDFYARTGQPAEGKKWLLQGQDRIEPNPLGLLGPGYALLGQLGKARGEYQRALAKHPRDLSVVLAVAEFFFQVKDYEQAALLFRRLLDLSADKSLQSQVDAKVVRRYLALSLALSGNPKHFAEARRQIKKNIKVNNPAAEDTLAYAHVLAADPETRQKAIKAFIEQDGLHPLHPADRFRLAQLYEAAEQWSDANEVLSRLLADDRSNAAYLAHRAHGLAQYKPKNEALQVLTTYAPEKLENLEALARSLVDLGSGDLAETMFRNYVRSSRKPPRAKLSLAAFLALRGKQAEALDLCDRAWATCPADEVSQVALLVLRAGPREANQVERVEQRLREAIDMAEDKTPLWLARANLRDLEGRYAEARKLYRQVLDKDPRNLGALNNLAWLLALADHPDRHGPEALSLIDRALALAPAQPGLLDTRALVLLSLGRVDEAVENLQESLEAEPSAEKYFHLAWAQHRRDPAASRAALAEALKQGLEPKDLHPLERPRYFQLTKEPNG